MQSFHAVVKPLGETRPGWKVLRVLATLLDVPGFDFNSSQDVLDKVCGLPPADKTHLGPALLSNATKASIDLSPAAREPVVASIYALESIVRRATSLQLTADAKAAATQEVAA